MLRRNLLASLAASGAYLLGTSSSVSAVTYQDYALRLTNIEREKAGVEPVVLGTNHADSLAQFCTSGHWGIDGTKPYMRYSLADGYQYNQENVMGLSLCAYDLRGSPTLVGNPAINIHRAIRGWLLSPGHRDNLLNEHHRKVNIGLAWDTYAFRFVQHLEHDYVALERMPRIVSGILSMSGLIKDATVLNGLNPIITIHYDPPLEILTVGQNLGSTSYFLGKPIVVLVSPNTTLEKPSTSYRFRTCGNPYDAEVDTSLPETMQDAQAISNQRRETKEACEGEQLSVPIKERR